MIISEKDIKTLEEGYISNIRSLVAADEIDNILDTIDDIIVDDILGHDDEPSDVGSKLQMIYDRIQKDNW